MTQEYPDELKKEISRAKERAVGYIAHSPRTERQIRSYLSEKEFGEAAIEEAVYYLKEIKYIDDEAYAEAYARQAAAKYGPRVIEARLRQRGVAASLAAQVCGVDGETQRAAALKIIKKYENAPEDKRRQRIYGALARAGFDWDEIKELLKGGGGEY